MATNLLQLLASDQAVSLATTLALQDADIEALINSVLPTNNQGAIAAENQRKLMFYVFQAGLRYSSIVQTHAGGEATKVLSAAGGKAIADSIASQVAAGMAALKADLLGGVGPAYDTLKELADLGVTEQNAITLLQTAVGTLQQAQASYVRADGSVPVTAPLAVADAQTGGQAVTMRQLTTGAQFGVSNVVNLLATGSYDLGTTRPTETGAPAQYFVMRGLYLCARQTSGTVVSAATITVGTNAPAYDNLCKYVVATVPPVAENIPLTVHAISIPAGTAIKARVLNAQVGGVGTYDIFGEGFYHTPAN